MCASTLPQADRPLDPKPGRAVCCLRGLLSGQALGGVGGFLRAFETVRLRLRAATLAQLVELFLGQLLDADVAVLRSAGANDLVELGFDRGTVAVLRVLDQEDHQEGDETCAGIDD